jgi:hypothetical protein
LTPEDKERLILHGAVISNNNNQLKMGKVQNKAVIN